MAQEKTNLVIPRLEAEEKINLQIREGTRIKDIAIQTKNSLERAKAKYNKWNSFNAKLLKVIFDTLELSLEYDGSIYVSIYRRGVLPYYFPWRVWIFRKEVQKKIYTLESIKKRLELFDEPQQETRSSETKSEYSSEIKKSKFPRSSLRKIFRVLFQYFAVALIFFLFIIGRNAFPLDYLTFAGIFVAVLLGFLVAFKLLRSFQGILVVIFAFILIILLRPSPL